MGALWRSEEMKLVQLYIQRDAAHDTFDELGVLGLVQFHDLNPNVNAFQRNFVNEVKKCDDLERRLRFLRSELEKEEKTLPIGQTLQDVTGVSAPPAPKLDSHQRPVFDIDDIENVLEQIDQELHDANDSYNDLKSNHADLLETMYVLQKDSAFFDAGSSSNGDDQAEVFMTDDSGSVPNAHNTLTPDERTPGSTTTSSKAEARMVAGLKVGYVSGVVLSSKASLFERVLWRALHGNMYFKIAQINDDQIVDLNTDEPVEKSVFVVFFHGQQSQIKIRKICDAFTARVVDVPNDRNSRHEMLRDVQSRLSDLSKIMESSRAHRREVLARVSLQYKDWSEFVRREKSIFNVMNMCNFDAGRKSLIAEGWVPAANTDDVGEALNRASKRCGTTASIMSVVRTKETPPTYFKVNEYTEVFDSIVESYGVATYGEVNPAALSVITFPFLFAIMFGDAGHAILLLLVSIAMCAIYPKIKGQPMNEIVDLLMSGRYLLVLMGLFSIYTGCIYNDFFSISLPFFNSSYVTPKGEPCHYGESCVKNSNNYTYPFGMDPIWRSSDNELYLSNSLKMKLSIVFGVVHMEAGIVMSLFNHIHFGHTIDIFFEFIPQIVFMTSTFGYLVFLIFFKWLSRSITTEAPYLINVFIDMFISFGHINGEELYDGQNGLQITLAILTIVSALVLLIPKPIIEYVQHKKKSQAASYNRVDSISGDEEDTVHTPLMVEHESTAISSSTTTTTTSSGGGASASAGAGSIVGGVEENDGDNGAAADEPEFSFSDAFINNAIHGIEFILGCISNTASYLRLWALSLAHAQLSTVFYERLFLLTISINFPFAFVLIFCGFGAWGGITIGILLGMEALSAFLHGLRLHWVEFMNKFYLAEGYAFTPFSFKYILEHINDDNPQ